MCAGDAWLVPPETEALSDPDTLAGASGKFSFRWFVPELLKHKHVWRDVLLASLALQLVALATPLFTQAIIDKVVVHRTQSTLIAPFNAQRVAQAFTDLITQGQGKYAFLVAASTDGRIVGALIGVMEQQIFSDAYTASVMHFDVLPEARMGGHGVRLLRAFEQWARNRKSFEITFGINSGVQLDLLNRFAVRMGYAKVGGNYAKSLDA